MCWLFTAGGIMAGGLAIFGLGWYWDYRQRERDFDDEWKKPEDWR